MNALSPEDTELALAQAVAFATYVEEHAKGGMQAAARKFLSAPFAEQLRQELYGKREFVVRFDAYAEQFRRDDNLLAALWAVVRAAGGKVTMPTLYLDRPKLADLAVSHDACTGQTTIEAREAHDTTHSLEVR